MGRKTVLLPLLGVLGAYYMYTPIPDNIEEKWKLICRNINFKTVQNLAGFLELLGINHFMDTLTFLLSFLEVPPTSDENVTVMDTTFNNVPVRVYVPNRKSQALRRGLFYVHGGGWCLGSAALDNYDRLSRKTVNRLDAVVISTNYRLAPKYHFPNQFEDVYKSLKWFLRPDVLEKYGVDPKRTGISGDSSGGNLAAAVAQKAEFVELLRINHLLNFLTIFWTLKDIPPTSDENITVTETASKHVPVCVYVPKRNSESLKRRVFHIHGWCHRSAEKNLQQSTPPQPLLLAVFC